MKLLLVALFFTVSLSGCGYIKSYFPDKHLDYQLTKEIPELVVPEDLSHSAIREQPGFNSRRRRPAYQNRRVVEPESEQVVVEKKQEAEAEAKPAVYVELVEFSGGASRIRIEESMERIWRTVGKALSRHSIEIIARDEEYRIYTVLYDADFKKVHDGSLWDEVVFMFSDDPAQEKEFKVRLIENGGFTEVLVLDKQGVPLSKGKGLKLLELLYGTIKTDLANRD